MPPNLEREFALINANRYATIKVNNLRSGERQDLLVYIVGYAIYEPNRWIAVAPSQELTYKEIGRYMGSYHIRPYTEYFVSKIVQYGFFCSIKEIKFLKVPENVKLTTPYPHRCKQCSSPARECDKNTLCSNLKCKTHKKISKFANTHFSEVNSAHNPILLKCKRCYHIAIGVNAINQDDNIYGEILCQYCGPSLYKFEMNGWYAYLNYVDRYTDSEFVIAKYVGKYHGWWNDIAMQFIKSKEYPPNFS